MKYPCFVWIGRIFQFKVLCFGVKNAPFTFNRLGQLFRKFFRGVSIIIYIDDTLVISDTSDRCKEDAQDVVNKLVELGLHIKLEKCSLQPSHNLYFLGFLLCQLPEEKLLNVKALCKESLSKNRVTVKLLLRLMGCVPTRPAVQMSRARSREIQRMVPDHYRGKSTANKLVILSAWAKEDVLWWRNLDVRDCNLSLRSTSVWQFQRLATDTMDVTIGSVFRGNEMYEVLDNNVARQPIAHNSRTGRKTLKSVMDWDSDIGPSTTEGIRWTSPSHLL